MPSPWPGRVGVGARLIRVASPCLDPRSLSSGAIKHWLVACYRLEPTPSSAVSIRS